ncbi:negative regulator of systemic acquired resistance SNI1 [Abrus precatorius]|uniref:Negative regulator of systemic acquired resistance SNI1 n=1 Tax=Abrus precatorius TaxID=3816 RepID=A0A8B8KU91_ABRPR|nr:negative regulator of systemic acquired resistance SNI1 [Abrus precatorius]XP_027347430.1 negative regulator of systemic acquired resistance SNI1 [Abrus precatorius]
MENPSGSERWNRAGIEDNMLAMFDASEAKDAHQDALDDRIAFLDAVRASSIVPEHGKPPTSKIFGAVFHMLRTGKSLELIMGSYKLLVDLDKHFPRVYLSDVDDCQSTSNSPSKLVVVKEAWSPIISCMDNATAAVSEVGGKQSSGPLDPSSFQLLIEELTEILADINVQAASVRPFQNMLLFQYIITVFEGDFLPRNDTLNWSMQRESLLNLLLVSRKINYKSLMKNCMTIICQLSQHLQNECSKYLEQESSESQLSKNCYTALSLGLLVVLKNTRVSMEKLLVMIMDLDMARKKADIEGHTTRADGARTPLMDIILDELAYSKDAVPVFLKNFREPNWKLEIVVQYLWKYITKPSVCTRKSNDHAEDPTFDGALKCFSNKTGAKSLIKKLGADVVQFLLAHGFQAQLSMLSDGDADDNIAPDKEGRASALVDLCRTFISAFDSLRSTYEHMEIVSIGKEALFAAAAIISMKS